MKFKSGDVVRVKSGGCPMTLSHPAIMSDPEALGWHVVYMAGIGDDLRREVFDENTLELVSSAAGEKT